MLRASLIAVTVAFLSGCFVATGPPPGEPLYEPPAVVEEPSQSVFVWTPWPHYEVEHHYVVEHDHVTIRDRHYARTYGRTRRYIRNDSGKHQGWYKHQHDRDHER